MNSKLQELKIQLGQDLVPAQKVSPRQGLSTGVVDIDDYLTWKGLPKGALSLFYGPNQAGGMALWQKTALSCLAQKKWVAWVDSPQSQFCPWSFIQAGADLSRLFIIRAPKLDSQSYAWILQELLDSSIFELIGCQIEGIQIQQRHLLKIQKNLKMQKCALALISRRESYDFSSQFSLVIDFRSEKWIFRRAQHRPPQSLERSRNYENIMFELATKRKPGYR